MKKALFSLLPLMLLASCGGPAAPVRESQDATPQQIQAQLEEYATKSQALTEGVNAALRPQMTIKGIQAMSISAANQQKLIKLRDQALTAFPHLEHENAWLAESSQLIAPKDARKVTNTMQGVFIIATQAQDNPGKTAWVAVITVDLDKQQILNMRLASDLKGNYQNPSYRNLGPDGKLPLIRRVFNDKSLQNGIAVQAYSEMQAPAESQLGVIVYRDGQVQQ